MQDDSWVEYFIGDEYQELCDFDIQDMKDADVIELSRKPLGLPGGCKALFILEQNEKMNLKLI